MKKPSRPVHSKTLESSGVTDI